MGEFIKMGRFNSPTNYSLNAKAGKNVHYQTILNNLQKFNDAYTANLPLKTILSKIFEQLELHGGGNDANLIANINTSLKEYFGANYTDAFSTKLQNLLNDKLMLDALKVFVKILKVHILNQLESWTGLCRMTSKLSFILARNVS